MIQRTPDDILEGNINLVWRVDIVTADEYKPRCKIVSIVTIIFPRKTWVYHRISRKIFNIL